MGDRAEQEKLHDIINKYYGGSVADFIKEIEFHLKVNEEKKHGSREDPICRLGNTYQAHGDFKKAIHYHELCLKAAKVSGDKAGEGRAYTYLGDCYRSLGDFKTAIYYHELHLKLAKELEDKSEEGRAYHNLGIDYDELGDFHKALHYRVLQLKNAKQLGDRAKEAFAYSVLGDSFNRLRDVNKAIRYHSLSLKIAKEEKNVQIEQLSNFRLGLDYSLLADHTTAISYYERSFEIAKQLGDRVSEARACNILGISYESLGDFKKAIEYSETCLKIAKEVGNRDEESGACCSLATSYRSLGDFKKAIKYSKLSLKIAKELGNRVRELGAYLILGFCYDSLFESKKAIVCHEMCLNIAKEMGNRHAEGIVYSGLADAYHTGRDLQKSIEFRLLSMKIVKDFGYRDGEHRNYFLLGCTFESLGALTMAVRCYKSSLRTLNDEVRLQRDDQWKISLRDMYHAGHTSLWQVLLKQEKIVEAMSAAEQGRAQALKDLLELKYGFEGSPNTLEETAYELSLSHSSNTIYVAYDEKKIVFWVSQKSNAVRFRSKQIIFDDGYHPLDEMTSFFQSFMQNVSEEIGVRAGIKCEDRSIDTPKDEAVTNERLSKTRSHYSQQLEPSALKKLYDLIIGPLRDLFHGQELIIVPEGPLCLAPFAAFMDSTSKYLSESFRIRVIPSLTSLKLIADCPADYHCKTGALLVGDPWVQEFTHHGIKLQQLPCAREEVKMIGRILNTAPLTGTDATKDAVLQRLSSVALVHIAAHGRMETGEIALAPNPTRKSGMPKEEDYLLTMKDVLSAKLRARLVVLSCCHSGRGEIKSEGVVGIARAFLGAGARSVLVSLWAIDDEATLEFMKSFYKQLVKGSSASESLNQAMKCMRESDKFSEVKYWAPFVLIGDDVTLEFGSNDE